MQNKTNTGEEEEEEEEEERKRREMGIQGKAAKASPTKKTTTLRCLFNLDSAHNGNTKLKNNICNNDPEADASSELLAIISYCTYVFTFTDPSESPFQQNLKRHKLSQILSIIKSTKTPFADHVLDALFSMLSSNLFRALPPPSNPTAIEFLGEHDEDSCGTPTPPWPHLHIVYDILLKLILNSDPKSLRKHVDYPFLLNLLHLFHTEDPRERESLKNVFHRIYSKFTFYRAFMRKSMNDVFLHFVFEGEHHGGGIGELLEIWGSIINGFTVPLKEEHKLFLMRVLVPLHKPKSLPVYHRQLCYCVSQLVQKDPSLGENVIKGILKYWRITNCQKEILLIGELEELVEKTDPSQFGKLALPLCSQVAKCLNSWNSQVAERALFMWNNEQFVKMASQAMEGALPSIVESLEKNLKWHWSKTVRQLTLSVKLMLEEMEPSLYSKCLQEAENRENIAQQEEIKRKEKWERLEMEAASNMFLQPYICVSN